MGTPLHRPVLLREVLGAFASLEKGVLVDATVGLGGHARAILENLPRLRVVGLDVDPEALEAARAVLVPFAARAEVVHASYHELPQVLEGMGIHRVQAVLFDLGVSSLQFDSPHRGFSFRDDGPLDMRFSKEGMSAAELVAELGEEDLARIFFEYGDEPRSRRVARFIVEARRREPIRTTGQLRRIVAAALGRRGGRTDPATRTFQALRIATNHELERLPRSLEQAARLLSPGGRLAAIAFHSLEDRIVKRTLRHLSGRCVCPPGHGPCTCRPEALLEVLTPRPIAPSAEEARENPRARSAKLRVAQRREP
jgi:16S rRNA (cytosine1402-N4)-methyltransferase